MAERPSDRWAARPRLSLLLRMGVVLVPVALALGAGVLLTHLLPVAHSAAGRIAWFVAVLAGSAVTLLLADRVARRVLPLAVLLELSLAFPDQAPSRMRAARTSSVREMERRLLALRKNGVSSEPIEAAETLVTLVGMLGVHDKRTRGHSERVRALTDLLSAEMRLNDDDRMRLRWAALIHDIGKLVVPAAVLNGSSGLSDEEWVAIRRHPDEGRRLAAGLLPWLGEWGTAIGGHHERWDGTGYPNGLSGDAIGLGARIVAVADSFEVMTSSRSYSKARTAAAAREELTRCAGTQFDPYVVRTFLGIAIGRLRWVLGPVTWLAQLPFAAAVDRAGQAAKGVATTALVGGLVAAGTLPGPGGTTDPQPVKAASPAAAPSAAPSPAGATPRVERLAASPMPGLPAAPVPPDLSVPDAAPPAQSQPDPAPPLAASPAGPQPSRAASPPPPPPPPAQPSPSTAGATS
ncbi:MAG: hypothetical protein JWN77_2643, partial [Frankiales bacterium]|nr:hypothetical protein [Frankiales bacterium]